VVSRVREFIRENFLYMRPGFVLADDARLLDRAILDSMAVMELIMFLKDEFGVTVPEHDIGERHLGTLLAIGDYVARARPRSAAQ
jgi:acyl carrier protein